MGVNKCKAYQYRSHLKTCVASLSRQSGLVISSTQSWLSKCSRPLFQTYRCHIAPEDSQLHTIETFVSRAMQKHTKKLWDRDPETILKACAGISLGLLTGSIVILFRKPALQNSTRLDAYDPKHISTTNWWQSHAYMPCISSQDFWLFCTIEIQLLKYLCTQPFHSSHTALCDIIEVDVVYLWR